MNNVNIHGSSTQRRVSKGYPPSSLKNSGSTNSCRMYHLSSSRAYVKRSKIKFIVSCGSVETTA